MPIESIPIGGIWKFLKWLPNSLLRRYFTAERLASLMYVDMRPRHGSAHLDLGPSASFTLYIQLINLSPFNVDLSRAKFTFRCGGSNIDAIVVNRKKLEPGKIDFIVIGNVIPDGHANQIANNYLGNSVALEGRIEFESGVRNFSKSTGYLDGVYLDVVNAHVRKNA